MDKDKFLDYYHKHKDRLVRGREAVLRNAYENALFWLDHQHIKWGGPEFMFIRPNTNRNVPRPVENLYRPKLMKPISRLAAIEPSLTYSPGGDKEDDRVTADNARLVQKYIDDVVGIEQLKLKLAYQTVIFGNAWLISGYDPTDGPMVEIDGKLEPQGEITADVASIFELLIDYTIPDMWRQPIIIWRKVRTLDWLYEHYPNAKRRDGDTATGSSDLGLTMLQNIIRLQPTLATMVGSGAMFSNAAVVDDVYCLPTRDAPNGYLARVIAEDEEVLEVKPNPFHEGTAEKRGRTFIPATHFGYEEVPGALLCTTPANSLKEPQRQWNRLIAHILLYFARTANGVWAIPKNADISTISGTEGVVIEYSANSAGGGIPQRLEGGNLPPSFHERLAQLEATMDKIIMVSELSEQFPRMDSPNMLNTLLEQQMQQLGPAFKRWGASWACAAKQLFYIFRNFAPEEVFYRIKGEEARWSFKKIATAELRGGIDIRVEPNSLMPRTPIQIKAAYEQMAQMLPQLLGDPNVQLKFARAFGATELLEGLQGDENQIAREHDALVAWARQFFDMETGELLQGVDPSSPALTLPILVDPDFDNHALHLQRHRDYCQSEEFQGLPLSVQDAFRSMHYRVHAMLFAQQQMAAAGPAEGGQPAKGEERPPAPPPAPPPEQPS